MEQPRPAGDRLLRWNGLPWVARWGSAAWIFAHKTLAKEEAHLCFRPLSMQKTKKSIAKRFKLTARGKLVRRTPGFRHLLGAKSTKQKRRASRDKLVAEGHAKPLKRALPFGL